MRASTLPRSGAAQAAPPQTRAHGWLAPAAVAVALAFAPLVLETYYQELVMKMALVQIMD